MLNLFQHLLRFRNKFGMTALFLILGSLVLFSCKKYPEDHKFMEFDSPAIRLQGTWLLTKYSMNNGDSTNYLYNQYDGYNFIGTPTPASQYGNLLLEVGTSENSFHQYPINIYSIGGVGTVKFINDKNYLTINFAVTGYKYYPSSYNDTVFIYSPFVDSSAWNIRELTKTNLILNNTINHTSYSIEFTKQKI